MSGFECLCSCYINHNPIEFYNRFAPKFMSFIAISCMNIFSVNPKGAYISQTHHPNPCFYERWDEETGEGRRWWTSNSCEWRIEAIFFLHFRFNLARVGVPSACGDAKRRKYEYSQKLMCLSLVYKINKWASIKILFITIWAIWSIEICSNAEPFALHCSLHSIVNVLTPSSEIRKYVYLFKLCPYAIQ